MGGIYVKRCLRLYYYYNLYCKYHSIITLFVTCPYEAMDSECILVNNAHCRMWRVRSTDLKRGRPHEVRWINLSPPLFAAGHAIFKMKGNTAFR